MPSWINDIVFPDGELDPEIEAMRQDMSEERFNQEIGADFTEFVGRVFKDFDEEVHVKDLQYNPNWPLVLATDSGWTNPFVCLVIQWDPFDNVYVLGEYRETNRDIEDVANDLFQWDLARKATDLFPEPAAPGDANILSKKLHVKVHSHTGGELKWRLELIRKHLKLYPEGQPIEKRHPKFWVDRTCTGLIREMLDYRYPDKREESVRSMPEAPLDKDNHGPEALGRFFRGHYGGPGDEGRTRAVVKKAVIR
jgi:hypothetical protein